MYNESMEKGMVEKRPDKPKWKTAVGDEVLENIDLIEYYKLHQLDEKYDNKLLGSFSSEGKYVLPDEMI